MQVETTAIMLYMQITNTPLLLNVTGDRLMHAHLKNQRIDKPTESARQNNTFNLHEL